MAFPGHSSGHCQRSAVSSHRHLPGQPHLAPHHLGSQQLDSCRLCKRPRHSANQAAAIVSVASVPAAATESTPKQSRSSTLPHPSADELQLRPEGDESQLPSFDPDLGQVHLAVVGAGPSGLSVAERVAAAGFRVCIIDPAPLAPWTNNYGVWKDEFAAMGLEDCLSPVWNQAHVFLDSSTQGKKWAPSRPITQASCHFRSQSYAPDALSQALQPPSKMHQRALLTQPAAYIYLKYIRIVKAGACGIVWDTISS